MPSTEKPGRLRPRAPFTAPRILHLAEPLEMPVLFASYSVVSTHDDGPGTSRDAVRQANASPGGDDIVFDVGTADVLYLTGGPLAFTDAVTVSGPEAGRLLLNGSGDRVLNVLDAAVVRIANLDITGSAVLGPIQVQIDAALTLDRCSVFGNTATDGGGVFNAGTLTLLGTTIDGNTASESGGGVYNLGTASLNGSVVSRNAAGTGGVIYNNGTLIISESSSVEGNVAGSGGKDGARP